MRNTLNPRTLAALLCMAACASAATPATPPPADPPESFGKPTAVATLHDMTGGTDTTNNINEQTLNGTMSDTEAKDTVSGSNVVSGTAFSNSAGLPTVIQNSGNNVLIQNATIVNVRMNP